MFCPAPTIEVLHGTRVAYYESYYIAYPSVKMPDGTTKATLSYVASNGYNRIVKTANSIGELNVDSHLESGLYEFFPLPNGIEFYGRNQYDW